MRVLWLTVRDCAGGFNNCDHTRPQISAIDVTEKISFERLYLIPGIGTFGRWVNCPYTPTTPTVHTTTISRFLCNFFPRMAPQFFGHHDSPRNLASPLASPGSLVPVSSHEYIFERTCRLGFRRKTGVVRLRKVWSKSAKQRNREKHRLSGGRRGHGIEFGHRSLSWNQHQTLTNWLCCHILRSAWEIWGQDFVGFLYSLNKRSVSNRPVILKRWCWVFLERTRILSGIQFTTHFIELFVVETKRFVGSFSNVILTRQTCGQRSSRAGESKRRALGNYFCEWTCYMFLISKCRGDLDLGLCALLGYLRKENRCALATSEKKRVSPAEKIGIWHSLSQAFGSGSLFASTHKV